jgi:hypothetical protein
MTDLDLWTYEEETHLRSRQKHRRRQSRLRSRRDLMGSKSRNEHRCRGRTLPTPRRVTTGHRGPGAGCGLTVQPLLGG